jgi:hypothetical protein
MRELIKAKQAVKGGGGGGGGAKHGGGGGKVSATRPPCAVELGVI